MYVVTISKYASAYIDIEPEIFVRSFVFALGAMALTGLLDHEDGVDVGAEVPGADVGATEEGNVHDLWLSRVEVDLKGEREERRRVDVEQLERSVLGLSERDESI